MPQEWRSAPVQPNGSAKRTRDEDDGTGGDRGHKKADRGDPTRRGMRDVLRNPNGPRAFATNRDLDQLLKMMPDLRLTTIAKAIGCRTITEAAKTAGAQGKECLNFNCLGFCPVPASCRGLHHNMPEDRAQRLAQKLQPGIRKLLKDHHP
jgi:hypothetical protein